MNTYKKHVFLIDDNEELLSDLERTLSFGGYTVYAFSDPAQFLEKFSPVVPAVLLMDMRMPNLSGIEIQEHLIAGGNKMPIIFMSGESTDSQIVKAFKNGANDFLLKPFGRESLLETVAKAIEQDAVVMQGLIQKAQLSEKLKSLSPRERQVFELLAKGYGNRELVEAIGISLPTAKQYKSEVMYKLRLRSLAELIALNKSIT